MEESHNMNMKELLEKFELDIKLPKNMMEFDVRNYEDYHTETTDDGKMIYVFTLKTDDGYLFEGILDTDDVSFHNFYSKDDAEMKYSTGGIGKDGIFI